MSDEQEIRLYRCDECSDLHAIPNFREVIIEERAGDIRVETLGGITIQARYEHVTRRLCESCWHDIIERTRAEDPWGLEVEEDARDGVEEVAEAASDV